MLETLKTILEWIQAVLTVLTGGFVFNIAALIVGWFPWVLSVIICLNIKRISKHRGFAYGNMIGGFTAMLADLLWRARLHEGSLHVFLNWISPLRGGQFMFLPIWIWGGLVGLLSILALASRAPKFVGEILCGDEANATTVRSVTDDRTGIGGGGAKEGGEIALEIGTDSLAPGALGTGTSSENASLEPKGGIASESRNEWPS